MEMKLDAEKRKQTNKPNPSVEHKALSKIPPPTL